ncbi:M85 family metallopeptidase, partial [Arsenophonus nasoniae]|uniref:M85 family metallopeptidase n=1 Tax=Arsenophonus nasoniae TaxID=638 RepID=UPI00387A2B5B
MQNNQDQVNQNEIFRKMDNYAEYVVTNGARAELSSRQIEEMIIDVRRTINDRASLLVDPHTAIAIEDTIHEALLFSQTFRRAVVFSLRVERSRLNFSHNNVLPNLYYMNFYELRDRDRDRDRDRRFQDITPEEISASTVDTVPIIGNPATACLVEDIYQNIICISVAPNYLSEHYQFWQYVLIHEIIHAITNAGDPPEGEERLGPTEILAYRIASEMDLRIPQFNSYHSLERERAADENAFACLCETIYRHHEHPTEVINRLFAINLFVENRPEDLNNHPPQYFQYSLPDHLFCDDNDAQIGSAFLMGASASHCTNNIFAAKYENIIFSENLPLTQFHLKKYNLVIAAEAFLRAKNGGGFKSKDYASWKKWYQKSDWKPIFPYGIYDYGVDEAEGNAIFSPHGLLFNDGSFSIGVTGKDVK